MTYKQTLYDLVINHYRFILKLVISQLPTFGLVELPEMVIPVACLRLLGITWYCYCSLWCHIQSYQSYELKYVYFYTSCEQLLEVTFDNFWYGCHFIVVICPGMSPGREIFNQVFGKHGKDGYSCFLFISLN